MFPPRATTAKAVPPRTLPKRGCSSPQPPALVPVAYTCACRGCACVRIRSLTRGADLLESSAGARWRGNCLSEAGDRIYGWTRAFVDTVAVRARGDRLFRPRRGLLRLGRPGAVRLSSVESGRGSHDGDVGLLDARIPPVPHRRLPDRRPDLVRCIREDGAALHGGPGLHGLRYPLVRHG